MSCGEFTTLHIYLTFYNKHVSAKLLNFYDDSMFYKNLPNAVLNIL